jgi:hypothetical protein
MKPLRHIALAGGFLATIALAPVALAQSSSPNQTLTGLPSGNQNKSARDQNERRHNQAQQAEALLQTPSQRTSKSSAKHGSSESNADWAPNVDHGGGAE